MPDKNKNEIEVNKPTAPEVPQNEPEQVDNADHDVVSEDPKVEAAVDDIAAKESDELLAVQDEKKAKAEENKKPKGKLDKIKQFIKDWWANPIKRKATIAGAIIFVILVISIPPSRYFVLNTVGVRSSASIIVTDQSTQLPLKNVQVQIANQSGLTDSDGRVKLTKVKLGRTNLVIEKLAFAPTKKTITIGLGSNPLGSTDLKAVGAQYAFTVSDFLSDKKIEKAEASSGVASALSDKDGQILLTVEASEDPQLEVTIKADNYRDDKITINTTSKANQPVKMVPAIKDVFISKRSGKYDLYKIDLDGKNEKVILAGSGNERDDLSLAPQPNKNVVALVSTRDNVRNRDGYLLSSLNIVDLSDNSATKITESERIQLIGWAGDKLIFIKVAAGASAANSRRERLMSYDNKTGDFKELATSNYFSDEVIVGDTVYYAPSRAYQNDTNIGLFKINTDGTAKQNLLNKETWQIFRVDYDNLVISTLSDWYEYKIGDTKTVKVNGQPANIKDHQYVDSPDKKRSLWVDKRDGKGVLLTYDVGTKADKIIKTQSGLENPVRWFNNSTLVYRIHTDQETADYALNIDGGNARKVKDVTNTTGLRQ